MDARAIVLVAGISSRIREATGGLPKSFLKVGEETLIGRTIRLLGQAGVADITLVVGYMEDLFRAAFPGCHFVVNPDFEVTNTCVSLELALRAREDWPVLVLNGDVYFGEAVLPGLLAHAPDTTAAVNRHPLCDEEVKVFVERDRVVRIGKHLNDEKAYGEAFGVYLLSPRFATYLKRELKLLNNPRVFYEEGMDRLLCAGHEMRLHDVGAELVQEVDFPEDYEGLKSLVSPSKT